MSKVKHILYMLGKGGISVLQTSIFDLVTLTLKFDLLLKNFNLGCNLVMVAVQRMSLSSDNSHHLIQCFAKQVVCLYIPEPLQKDVYSEVFQNII